MSNRTVYLDNASTSHPKPDVVWEASKHYLQNIGAAPGRSGSHLARQAESIIASCRVRIAELFNIKDVDSIVFTSNSTHALNTIIKGVLKQNDHVIFSNFEHNSVIRPLEKLKRTAIITTTLIESDKEGQFSITDFENAIQDNTKLVIINHASNVLGVVAPISEIIKMAHRHNVQVLVDASQTTGVLDIDIEKLGVDFLAFTGHKSLLGPSGTGGFYAKDPYSVDTIMEGGSGSNSQSALQPGVLPDKFEAGTMNYLGIAGLGASIGLILNESIKAIRERELSLTQYLIDGLGTINNVVLYGTNDMRLKVPVVSFNIENIPSNEVSALLDSDYQIITRPGLHCAPLVHKSIGTFPNGTVRVSLGPKNDKQDIDTLLEAVKLIASRRSND